MIKVAIITNFMYDTSNCGKNAGGGAVLITSVIDVLKSMPDVSLTVIAYHSLTKNFCDFETILIPRSEFVTETDFLSLADNIIKKRNFDFVFTFNIGDLYINNFLQCHSYRHRCKNTLPLFSLIKFISSREKLKIEKNRFSKLSENSKFISVSETIRNDYSKNFNIPKENIKVIYPGCKKIYEEFPSREKKDMPTLSVVANSSINKGGHLFLFAAGIAKLLGASFRLQMIAPKFDKDFLLQFIVNIFGLKKYIKVLPKQDDMTEFYESTYVLVLPSLNEAFGLVVIEAASYGICSVISDTAGVSEIFDENSGIIFNRNSLSGFIDSLIRISDMYNNNFEQYLLLCRGAFILSQKYTQTSFAKKLLNR